MRDDVNPPSMVSIPSTYDPNSFRWLLRNIEIFFTRMLSKGPINVSNLTADQITMEGPLDLNGNNLVNVGSSVGDFYESATWTPEFSFITPGDLSVAYSTQSGIYTTIGNLVFITAYMIFVPTYTTSSGNASLSLPVAGVGVGTPMTVGFTGPNTVWPAGTTQIIVDEIGSIGRLRALGSGINTATMGTANYPSGVSHILRFGGVYQK